MGLTLRSAANAVFELIRCRLSPAMTSSVAATSGPTPWRRPRPVDGGARLGDLAVEDRDLSAQLEVTLRQASQGGLGGLSVIGHVTNSKTGAHPDAIVGVEIRRQDRSWR